MRERTLLPYETYPGPKPLIKNLAQYRFPPSES